MDSTINFNENANQSPARKVLGNYNFRLLWIGEGISVLGDHFYMIALPWLVLQLTGDPLAMGTVLALSAIPRALLMLVGGAFTDRFSPRNLMLISNAVRFVLVSLLTGLVFTNLVQLWMIYILAVAFGVADAFFYPAQSSMPPLLVKRDELQIANSLMHGTMMLAMLVGPVLAGVLIALLGDGQSDTLELTGIATALGVDALTFLASLVTLSFIKMDRGSSSAPGENIMLAIQTGLRFVWNDVPLRGFVLVVAAVTFFFDGPFSIGVPLLADTRFPEGAVAYGTILSSWAAGSLLGMAFAGFLPRPASRIMGSLLLGLVGIMGLGLGLLGMASSMIAASAIGLLLGTLKGYVNIFFTTWVQSRAPEHYIGRLMSLLMFASTGLYPISMALSGAVSRIDVTSLLVIPGGIVLMIGLVLVLNPNLRAMEPAPQSGD